MTGQKKNVSSPAMDMNILDIHGKELKRPFSYGGSQADKIPFKRLRSYSPTVQQVGLFHQPVHLFMVNDPAQLLEFTGYVTMAIATELLMERLFHVLKDYRIFKELSILFYGVSTGSNAFRKA